MMRRALGIVAAVAGIAAAAPLEAALTIEHHAVGCVLADRHPRLEARFDPAAQVGRARVFFRASGTPHWYSVEMAAQAGLWSGVLPKPKRSTSGIEYYLEVTDRALVPTRTAEQAAVVVAGPLACKDAPLAAVSTSAQVAVSAAAGAPAVPAGFLHAGLLAAGGGLSTPALVGIIGGGAVVGGAVVVGRRGGERPLSIAGSWVGTGADGMSRDSTTCHRDDDLFFELTQSGDTVSGTARYVTRAGTNCNLEPLGTRRDFTVTGTLHGPAVSLALFNVLGVPGTHAFTGTLQGSRLSGTVVSTFPEGAYRGTWSVRRP